MADELLDYVDENDNILGQVWRSEIDKKGLIGRIVCLLVYNSKGEVLVSKNALRKKNPNMWTFGSAGHITSGQTPEFAMVREAKEEIGIDVVDLEKVMVIKNIAPEKKAKRIDHIFKTNHSGPFILDENEISECQFLSLAKIDEIIMSRDDYFTQTFTKFWKIYRNL